MDATELATGVFGLTQKKGGHVYAFVLDDGTSLTLIDTLYDTDGARVLAQLRLDGSSAGGSEADRDHARTSPTSRRSTGGTRAHGSPGLCPRMGKPTSCAVNERPSR